MTITVPEIWDTLRPEPEFVNGRYVIIPPGEKKLRTYQRVSNFKRPATDTYNFEQRDKRMIALGLAARPDMLLEVAACHPDDNKRELNRLCEAAQDAAGASAKANIGKAIHRITARIDLGETVAVPAAYQADIDAYQATLTVNDITVIPEYVERVCVLPDLGVAGQFDRLYQFGSRLFVGDIKTGSVDFGFGDMAIQLALYANAETIYDTATHKHQPMPEHLDKTVGLIVHIPAGRGRCDLYWVDLTAGWEAAQYCLWIRNWRNRRDLAERWTDDEPCTNPEVNRVRLIERIQTLIDLGAKQQVADNWPTGIPGFKHHDNHTPEQLIKIGRVLTEIEKLVQAPFGPLSPKEQP